MSKKQSVSITFDEREVLEKWCAEKKVGKLNMHNPLKIVNMEGHQWKKKS
jgi:hypothetical protein